MSREAMGFAANGLGIGGPPIPFGGGHGRVPGGGFRGGIEVDFAAFVVGPKGDAADDFGGGFGALGLEFGHVKTGDIRAAAGKGGEDPAIAEDVEPADGHGHLMAGARGWRRGRKSEALDAGFALISDALEGGRIEDGEDEGALSAGRQGSAGLKVLANLDGFIEVNEEGLGAGPLGEFGEFGGEVRRALGVHGLGGVEGIAVLEHAAPGGGVGVRLDAEDANHAGLGRPVVEGAEALGGAADLGDDDLDGEIGKIANIGKFGAVGGGPLLGAVQGEDGEDEEGDEGHGAEHNDQGDAVIAAIWDRCIGGGQGCFCHHNVKTWYRECGWVSS